jgi:hypothetical protein
MLSVPACAFADWIAARKVQGPKECVLSIAIVPQTPSLGTGSPASPVLSTVKIAAVADHAIANPITGTSSARNLLCGT